MSGQPLRLAHLVLAHNDPVHIVRLCRRLAQCSEVFVHIDANAALSAFAEPLKDCAGVHFLPQRLHCRWGAWNAVLAELALLRAARAAGPFDRYVFLQGADYPLQTNEQLLAFYAAHPQTEFARGCDCTISKDPYFSEKCRVYWLRNTPILPCKLAEQAMARMRIHLRKGTIPDGTGGALHAFWGSAQWAFTDFAAQEILAYSDSHPDFNRWFYHAFPADEMYFVTLVMNQPALAARTAAGGPEPEQRGLVNWRNLHYFEYPPGAIRIWTEADYDFVSSRPELYLRKVTTAQSTALLDRLDRRGAESKSVSE